MTRARYRFRNWSIVPDREPDAEPVNVRAQCAVCKELGEAAPTGDEALTWAQGHLKAKPEHLTYRLLAAMPYRAVPGEWL